MDALVMNMKFLQHKLRLYISENYSRTISVGAGIEADFLTPRKVMYQHHNTLDQDNSPVNTLGTFAYLHYDNLNKSNFPTRGVAGKVNFTWKDMLFDSQRVSRLGYGSIVFGL